MNLVSDLSDPMTVNLVSDLSDPLTVNLSSSYPTHCSHQFQGNRIYVQTDHDQLPATAGDKRGTDKSSLTPLIKAHTRQEVLPEGNEISAGC